MQSGGKSLVGCHVDVYYSATNPLVCSSYFHCACPAVFANRLLQALILMVFLFAFRL
jgi:hypothetical protein